MKSLEQMQQFIADFKTEHGELPPRKPTTDEHRATVAKIDETVRPVLIRYAKLVNESQQVPDIDTTKLEAYAAELDNVIGCDDWNLDAHARLFKGALHAVINR